MTNRQHQEAAQSDALMPGVARLSAGDQEFPLGAHLVTSRRGYTHHGIYVGAGKVVHYAGLSWGIHRGPVEEVPLEEFADKRVVKIKFDANARYSGAQVAARARSRLGEDRYRLISNNCEHFCEWCARGESRSEQVENFYAWPRRAMFVALARLRQSFSAGLGDRRDETCAV
jgi:hypothetical protein